MSIANHVRFCIDLPAALFHEARAKYYELALRHVGNNHPDSWLLTRRMLISRMKSNDIISRWTQT